MVDVPVGKLGALVVALGSEFEIDLDMLRDAIGRRSCCKIFFLPVLTKFDLFAPGSSAFDASEFAWRRPITVRPSGETLVLESPEDTILRKLLSYGAGVRVSDRQWRDVIRVIRVNTRTLDDAYLDAWARRLGLGELLADVRADAQPATRAHSRPNSRTHPLHALPGTALAQRSAMIGRRIAGGIVAGLVGTVTMSAFMAAARSLGALGEPPPLKITRRTFARAGVHLSRSESVVAAWVLHFGIGASLGAIHALLPGERTRMHALPSALFGAGAWAAAYEIILPALGLMPEPDHDRPGRPSSMALAHVVFGGTLAAVHAVSVGERTVA